MAERVRSTYKDPDAYDKIEELRKLVGVDKHELDDNLEQQPDLFFRVATAYEIAKSASEISEHNIKELEASLDREIREDAGDEKITEPEIKRRIVGHRDMRAAITDMLEKREIAGRWGALKGAYEQRSYSMKALAGLHTSGYFTNSVSSSARREDREARANEAGAARTRELARQRGER